MSTVTEVVPCGLIGAVLASGADPPSRLIDNASDWLAWLVTMKMTGPAPADAGETDTRWSLTYTVMLTGIGGRFFTGDRPPTLPQPATAVNAIASVPIVLMRIVEPALLTLTNSR